MKTIIFQYRDTVTKSCFSGLTILFWFYMLIQHVTRYGTVNDVSFYGLLIAYVVLIVGVSMVFVDSLMRKTIIIHKEGIFINKRNYTHSDIISIRMTEKQIYIRVKKDGTYAFFRKQFTDISQEDLDTTFSELQTNTAERESVQLI